jgi:hypothetical protein
VLLVSVAKAAALGARDAGFPGKLIRRPRRLNVPLGLKIVLKVPLHEVTAPPIFGAELLEVNIPTIRDHLGRDYLATGIAGRLCDAKSFHLFDPPKISDSPAGLCLF